MDPHAHIRSLPPEGARDLLEAARRRSPMTSCSRTTRRGALIRIAAGAAALAAPWSVHAQAFPNRPITLVLPFPP
jgi:hypothetical protein